MLMKVQHMSKTHAQFCLSEGFNGVNRMLMLQDISSNGTWLNGQKMHQGRFVQVQPGDRISFLTPSLACPDLTYELMTGALSTPFHAVLHGGTEHSGHVTTSQRQGSSLGAGCGHGQDVRSPLAAQASPRTRAELKIEQSAVDDPHRCRGDFSVVPCTVPDRVSAASDIDTWVRSLDGGRLAGFCDLIVGSYDDLQQIRDLYAEHADDFFEDLEIHDVHHKDVFRKALAELKSPPDT